MRGANVTVSENGTIMIPVDVQRRWGIEDGDDLVFIDLGDAALLMPDGALGDPRREIIERYEAGLAAIDDPDLVDQ